MSRPTVITAKVVRLLVTCFQNGLTVRQACWQSGVSHEAYYQRLRSDSEFADIMSKAQQLPSMTARNNVLKAIKKGDLSSSRWWLERKDKEEFSSKADVTMQEEVTTMPSSVEVERIRQSAQRFNMLSDEEQLIEAERILEDHRKIVEQKKRVREYAREQNMRLFGQETIPVDFKLPPHVKRKQKPVLE